jgi:hypothetical protein
MVLTRIVVWEFTLVVFGLLYFFMTHLLRVESGGYGSLAAGGERFGANRIPRCPRARATRVGALGGNG